MKRFIGPLLVLVGVCFAQQYANAAEPIHTSQTQFRIPYQFDQNEMARIGAVEIRLYGSTDSGKSWKLLQTVPPKKGKFSFSTKTDGEYWFAVKTANANGQLFPSTPTITPGLKVVVDTEKPSIQLDAAKDENGRTIVTWKLDDKNLDLTSFGLEYRRKGDQKWTAMIVAPAVSGQTTLAVANTGKIEIRARVQDLSDNDVTETLITDTEKLAPMKANDRQPFKPDFSQPIADETGEPKQTQEFASSLSTTQPDLVTIKQVPVSANQKPIISPGRPRGRSGNTDGQLISQKLKSMRTVRSNEFQIDYELAEVGPSGIGSVELYISPNGGAQWWKYGNDNDKKSPAHVRVPEDGEYSFIIRVTNGVGFGAPKPAPGDKPTMMILVDRSAPKIQVSPIEQGRGKDADKLTFRWSIEDNQLSEKPVSLFYSAQPNGTWKTIASSIENSGSHEWRVPQGEASQLYFKIVAVDHAGNSSFQQTTSPLMIDLATPTAKVLGVSTPK